MTPDDVIFSFDVFKKNSPFYGAYYRHVTKVEKTGEREITFTFDGPGNRELPQIVGQLPVLPKHWWEGTDKSGNKRDITQTTLEPPLGSRAVPAQGFRAGPHAGLRKGRGLLGQGSQRQHRHAKFPDRCATNISATPRSRSKAFKGDQVDWRTENSAKDWANVLRFPGGARQARGAGGVSDSQSSA